MKVKSTAKPPRLFSELLATSKTVPDRLASEKWPGAPGDIE